MVFRELTGVTGALRGCSFLKKRTKRLQNAKLRFARGKIIISERVPFNLDEVSVEGERWGGAYPRKYRSRWRIYAHHIRK